MQSSFFWAALSCKLLTQSPHLPVPTPFFCAQGLAGKGALLTPPPIPGSSGPLKLQVLFGGFSNFHFLSPFDGSGWAEAARKTNAPRGFPTLSPTIPIRFQVLCLCLLGRAPTPESGGGRAAFWAFVNWTWLEKGEGGGGRCRLQTQG